MSRIHIIFLSLILSIACQTRSGTEPNGAAPPERPQPEAGESVRGFPGGKLFNNYLLFIPADYNTSDRKYPVILFLHNAIFRGSDISKLKTTPFWQAIKSEADFPFIVISPLCPAGRYWTDDQRNLMAILDDVEQTYRVDPGRVFLTGHSIGGAAAWILAASYPERFAAIAPLSNGIEMTEEQAGRLKDMRIWAFHGEADEISPLALEQKTVDLVKRAGNKGAKFSILPGRDHMIQEDVYQKKELFRWFLE